MHRPLTSIEAQLLEDIDRLAEGKQLLPGPQVNSVELKLLHLVDEAVKYKNISVFHKILYDVSWRGFFVGTLATGLIMFLCLAVFKIQGSAINTGAIFVAGVFASTVYMTKFAAFVMTTESIVSNYFLFIHRVGHGNFTVVSASIIFAGLLFGVFAFVRDNNKRHQKELQVVAKAAVMSVCKEKIWTD